MSTQDIYNYRKVNDQLITGGQPNEGQLISAAEEGFTTVINLATIGDLNSLVDEANLVHSLGMTYFHIPVEWQNPTMKDFNAFENLIQRLTDSKTLIHCAANFRVTAFYALYALKHLGWSEARAEEFRMSVWQGNNYPVWEKFISDAKAQILNSNPSE